ncbi:MAG: retroviral-like aspartic protease family protein [Novosphingobium sp.]|uniref:retroviral-like aspartic protease family protein n=1 Tax=Novosphingobium sp. TaxID=1874826 RepID=UPI0032BDFEF2
MPINPAFAPLLPFVAMVPVLTAQQSAPQAAETDVIAIRTDSHDRMTVPVRISEQGPFRFMIDTGSQNTVISTSLASRLSLEPRNRARLVGVAGFMDVDTVAIEQIDLGRRSYYSVRAPTLARDDIGADGILGLDSLQGQRVLIDFRKGVIMVNDARALGGNQGFDLVVTARRKSGQLIMADAKIDGVRVNVVIDTGAEYSIGNRALQDALRNRSPQGQAVLKSVTGQEITADLALAKSLVIDDINFSNVIVAYADAPPFAILGLSEKPALFLGMRDMRSLDRIAIDFSTRRIYFDVPNRAFDN